MSEPHLSGRKDGKGPEAFRTIREAARLLGVPQHVLRFWETRFKNIKPMKRAGGRRYYSPDDVSLLCGIQYLLYDQGYTIKGVQKILRERGSKYVANTDGLRCEPRAQTDTQRDIAETGALANDDVPHVPDRKKIDTSESPDSSGDAKRPLASPDEGADLAHDEDDANALNGVLIMLLKCKKMLDEAHG